MHTEIENQTEQRGIDPSIVMHLYKAVWGPRTNDPYEEHFVGPTREQCREWAVASRLNDKRELVLHLVKLEQPCPIQPYGYDEPVWCMTKTTKHNLVIMTPEEVERVKAENQRMVDLARAQETEVKRQAAIEAAFRCFAMSPERLEQAIEVLQTRMALERNDAIAAALSLYEVSGGRGPFGPWMAEPYHHVEIPRDVYLQIRWAIGRADLVRVVGEVVLGGPLAQRRARQFVTARTEEQCGLGEGEAGVPGEEWLAVLLKRKDLWQYFDVVEE
jgi:hypothetical protein